MNRFTRPLQDEPDPDREREIDECRGDQLRQDDIEREMDRAETYADLFHTTKTNL